MFLTLSTYQLFYEFPSTVPEWNASGWNQLHYSTCRRDVNICHSTWKVSLPFSGPVYLLSSWSTLKVRGKLNSPRNHDSESWCSWRVRCWEFIRSITQSWHGTIYFFYCCDSRLTYSGFTERLSRAKPFWRSSSSGTTSLHMWIRRVGKSFATVPSGLPSEEKSAAHVLLVQMELCRNAFLKTDIFVIRVVFKLKDFCNLVSTVNSTGDLVFLWAIAKNKIQIAKFKCVQPSSLNKQCLSQRFLNCNQNQIDWIGILRENCGLIYLCNVNLHWTIRIKC